MGGKIMLRRDVLTNGIDVSQYQGLINWEVVKNHIDFAIIRCGYGQDIIGQDDELFKRNPVFRSSHHESLEVYKVVI